MKISIDKITNGTMFTMERLSFLLACVAVPAGIYIIVTAIMNILATLR